MPPLSQYKRYNQKKIELFYDGAYSRRIVCYSRANVCGSAEDSPLEGDLP